MRQIIGFLLIAFLAFESTNSESNVPKAGPYDWNNLMTEVTTTCHDVEAAKEIIEKTVSTDPSIRINQEHEVSQMLTRIILIQDMINKEYKYRDQLDQSQKTLLDTYKNKTLRLRQELTALEKKLNNY